MSVGLTLIVLFLGQLSHWLHGAVDKNKQIGFVLIDRSHVRNKVNFL